MKQLTVVCLRVSYSYVNLRQFTVMFYFILVQTPVTWTPIEPNQSLGQIDFAVQITQILTLPDSVPDDVEELLLFVIVDISNSTPNDQKGFVKVFTEVERMQCAKYIAIHTCTESKNILQAMRTSWMTNSNSMWLPVGTDAHRRKVYVEVLDRSQQGKMKGKIMGEVYLSGYR